MTVRRAILAVLLAAVASASEKPPLYDLSLQWVDYYAGAYQVPADLVSAVIAVESNWNPYALSPVGAGGLMQLMPATARSFGVRNRFHIPENIRGGVKYLARLISRFDGDLRLVVAAYFAGEERIARNGLAYSSPAVHRYVSEVARRYRANRRGYQTAGRN